MSELQFNGLGDFAARFPQVGLRFLEEIAKETQRELMARGLSRAQVMTPRLSGAMAGRWSTRPPNAQAAIDRLKPTAVINTARQAKVLDQGLRQSKPFARKSKTGRRTIVRGRRIGSPFAPRGISGPLVEELMGQMDEIVAGAVATAEARLS